MPRLTCGVAMTITLATVAGLIIGIALGLALLALP
jgi:hypothetical protein